MYIHANVLRYVYTQGNIQEQLNSTDNNYKLDNAFTASVANKAK